MFSPPSGIYVCSQCNHPLFSSRSKFAHSSPWPAFTDTIREDSVTKMMETLTAFKVRNTTWVLLCFTIGFSLFYCRTFVHQDMAHELDVTVFIQVLCGKCGNGLGHEFVNDGPEEGVSRFWIFSHSLKFVPKGKMTWVRYRQVEVLVCQNPESLTLLSQKQFPRLLRTVFLLGSIFIQK